MRMMALSILLLASATAMAAADATASSPTRNTTVYGDWRLTCSTQAAVERCSVSQLQSDPESGQRALAIEFQSGEAGGLNGVLALPFGLALPRGVLLALDDAAPGKDAHGFSTCLPDGCIVPLRFDAEGVKRLRASRQLKVHAIAAADGTHMVFQISLEGFGEAIDQFK
jgi:invasion protein IalB